jgi:hypothetical protein
MYHWAGERQGVSYGRDTTRDKVGERREAEAKTYLEQIQRDALLGAQRVHVHPAVREARLVEALLLVVAPARELRDVVLLHDAEAGAQHGRHAQALEQLRAERRVALVADRLLQQPDQLLGGLEHGVALPQRDAVRHVPRQLLERRDHALVGALRAVLAEGGLCNERKETSQP